MNMPDNMDPFNFNDNVGDTVENLKTCGSSDSDDGVESIERAHKKEDLKSRHEIISNIYKSLICITKPRVLLSSAVIFIIIYPFSYIEIPEEYFKYPELIKRYISIIFEIIRAFASFIVGAILSNWISVKINGTRK